MAEDASRTTVVNLDELVPRTRVFELHGEQWLVPGDIDVETTFSIQRLLLDLADAEAGVMRWQIAELEAEDNETREEASRRRRDAFDLQATTTLEMEREILGLFKIHQPELMKLPFGAAAFKGVLAHILAQLGFGEMEEEDALDEDPTPIPTPPRMDVPKSRPSSGSSASPTSSDSEPTSGDKEEE